MSFFELNLPKGVFPDGADYNHKNLWRNCNLIRWNNNILQSIGGWKKERDINVLSITETIGDKGAEKTKFCHPRTSFLFRGTSEATSKSAINLSPIVISNWNSVAVLKTSYDKTWDKKTKKKIWDKIIYKYSGIDDPYTEGGYGHGNYGTGYYGIGRSLGSSSYRRVSTCSFDMWGDILIFTTSMGEDKIQEWTPGSGVVFNNSTEISNSPYSTYIIVTNERFLMSFGTNANSRLIKWSDRENRNIWVASTENEAGDFELPTDGAILAAKKLKNKIIILTTNDVFVGRYIGPPFVYSFNKLGSLCGCLSANGCNVAGNFVYWIGNNSFYRTDGINVEKIPCALEETIFKNSLYWGYESKIVCIPNEEFSEIWWFYPSSKTSSSKENTTYVIYNYEEGVWYNGMLNRSSVTTGTQFYMPLWFSPGIAGETEAASEASVLYEHETGQICVDYSYLCYIESGFIEIDTGESLYRFKNIYPDFKTIDSSSNEINFDFSYKYEPNGMVLNSSTYKFNTSSFGKMDINVEGREVKMKITFLTHDNIKMGNIRFNVEKSSYR